MYSKIEIQEKLDKIEQEKNRLTKMLNDMETLTPEQELAVMLQEMFRFGDSWGYEFIDNKHDWNGYHHKNALNKANTIIKFVIENFRCTEIVKENKMTLNEVNDNFEDLPETVIKDKWLKFVSELAKLNEQQIYSLVMDYCVLDGFTFAENDDFFGTEGMSL